MNHINHGLLEKYRAQGPLRLKRDTCETQYARCPFGLATPTEIILDHWNPSKVKWRVETHCDGPQGCPRYKPEPPYRAQAGSPT